MTTKKKLGRPRRVKEDRENNFLMSLKELVGLFGDESRVSLTLLQMQSLAFELYQNKGLDGLNNALKRNTDNQLTNTNKFRAKLRQSSDIKNVISTTLRELEPRTPAESEEILSKIFGSNEPIEK